MSAFVEWIQTTQGMLVSLGVFWLVVSIGFCFLLGRIAGRLKNAPREGKKRKSGLLSKSWVHQTREQHRNRTVVGQ